MIKRIQKEITISPSCLTKNIKSHLLDALKIRIQEENCSYEHGYILEIKKIISYSNNYVSNANSMIVFTVVFEALILNPTIGSNLDGVITMIHTSGIFIEVKSRLKVLVLEDKMNNMIYDSISNTYKSPDEKQVIKTGDVICVKIIGIRYQDKNISCYGQLAI